MMIKRFAIAVGLVLALGCQPKEEPAPKEPLNYSIFMTTELGIQYLFTPEQTLIILPTYQ